MRCHLYHCQGLGDALPRFRLRPFRDPQTVGDVLFHAQVRKKRIVLEDSVDAATIRWLLIEPLRSHPELARARRLETRNDAEQGGLA